MQQTKYRFGRRTPIDDTVCNGRCCHTAISNTALFDFGNNHPASVSVENIPEHISRREIVTIFNSLIGEVRGFQDIRDGAISRLDITFSERDSAAKALCMNGFTVAGVPLMVSATLAPFHTCAHKQIKDDRRNLYVLGLPFALTKNEFASIFSQFGTVSHCVILATVDNSSRRRGFVVMSSHEEALKAMSSLSHTVIKGHSIDVSWAVVQRSQGFLDGGDRAILMDSRSQMASPGPQMKQRHSMISSDSSDSSLESHEADPASLETSSEPTRSLLVTNLPTLLFSQAQDLQPLFFPFGHIEKLEIVQVSPLGTMSVLVQYSHPNVAQEAKESLSGQLYGSYRIEARYVRSPSQGLWQSIHAPQSSTDADIVKRPSLSTLPFNDPANLAGRSRSYPGFFSKEESGPIQQSHFTASRLNTAPNDDNRLRLHPSLATHSPFSNVFDDPGEFSTSASAKSRWNLLSNYGPLADDRRSYALSKQMHFNTLYSSSAA